MLLLQSYLIGATVTLASAHQESLILENQSVLGSLCGLQPEWLWVLVLSVWAWGSLCREGWTHHVRTLTRKW